MPQPLQLRPKVGRLLDPMSVLGKPKNGSARSGAGATRDKCPSYSPRHVLQGPFRLQAAGESVRACSLPTRYAEELRIESGTSHYNSEKGGRKQMQRASWSSLISPQI